MRTLGSRLAALTAAAVLLPAATALAAPPDKQATLTDVNPSYAWTGTGSGAVYTSTVANKVGCNPVLFACDLVLLKTEVPGALTLTADGADDNTLKDIDLHLYESDDQGTNNGLWDESTGSTAHESLAETDLPAGYWLVRVDYYLGAGTYSGTANFTPNPTP